MGIYGRRLGRIFIKTGISLIGFLECGQHSYTLIVKCLWTYLASVKYRQDETLEFSLKICRGEIMRSISIVHAFHGVILELVVFGYIADF